MAQETNELHDPEFISYYIENLLAFINYTMRESLEQEEKSALNIAVIKLLRQCLPLDEQFYQACIETYGLKLIGNSDDEKENQTPNLMKNRGNPVSDGISKHEKYDLEFFPPVTSEVKENKMDDNADCAHHFFHNF